MSAPRSIVLIGGYEVPFLSWRVENTGFETADTFEVDLPFEVTDQLQDQILTSNNNVSSILFSEKDILVEIFRGTPKDPSNFKKEELRRTIVGYVDVVSVQFDVTNGGEIVKLEGRDLSALLIDNQITDKYQNSTSSQIAQTFAAMHGFGPQIHQTRTLAGTYYNNDSSVISDTSSEWDLLMYLAQQEGFVVRIYGTTLYFGPISQVTDINLPPIVLTWGDNIETLDIERSPHAARDIKVEVISYDRNSKQKIVGTAQGTSYHTTRLPNPLNRDAYTEIYRIPGLTKAQADEQATTILQNLSLEQLTGPLKTYGEMDFTVDRKITLKGTGAVLSQDYYISRVTENFDLQNGFDAEIAFINQLLMPGGSNYNG
jgi:phage protein D